MKQQAVIKVDGGGQVTLEIEEGALTIEIGGWDEAGEYKSVGVTASQPIDLRDLGEFFGSPAFHRACEPVGE